MSVMLGVSALMTVVFDGLALMSVMLLVLVLASTVKRRSGRSTSGHDVGSDGSFHLRRTLLQITFCRTSVKLLRALM
jgi:hypothetical protein